MHRVLEVGRQRLHARGHVFLLQDVQHRVARRAGHGVGGVGVAVGKFEHVLGAALCHEGVVDLLARHAAAQRLGAVGHLLGEVQDVRRHAEHLGARPAAAAAEAGDDLVEDQQDVVLRADLAQALQVASRRDHHTGRAGERLHDHGGDVARVVQGDHVQQLVGQGPAVGVGHALEERAHGRLRVGNVVGLHRLAEGLAVAHHAAHRDAAEVHAVVALLINFLYNLDVLDSSNLDFKSKPIFVGHISHLISHISPLTAHFPFPFHKIIVV